MEAKRALEGSDMSRQHILKASADTVHWGYFDAGLPPVLEIDSGDLVRIETVSGAEEVLPIGAYEIPPEYHEIHARAPRPLGSGHILTGPVAVRGACPGDVLEVRIRSVDLRTDWGWNLIRPLAGALPEDFPEKRLLTIPLDKAAKVAKLPWGVDLLLSPFFGVMGTAPPPAWGMQTSIVPRAFGGNLDNKELGAGATLYLPVFVEGALFSAGDGHALQGDGEVCVTAIETSLTGLFELHLRHDMRLDAPMAETDEAYITMGVDPDLDQAAKQALRAMIDLIVARANLSREDAYTLCSIVADLRVTQVVNGNKGAHVVLAKRALHGD